MIFLCMQLLNKLYYPKVRKTREDDIEEYDNYNENDNNVGGAGFV